MSPGIRAQIERRQQGAREKLCDLGLLAVGGTDEEEHGGLLVLLGAGRRADGVEGLLGFEERQRIARQPALEAAVGQRRAEGHGQEVEEVVFEVEEAAGECEGGGDAVERVVREIEGG